MAPTARADAPDLTITHSQANGRGRYHAPLPDGSEAELTYRVRAGDGARIIDHTGVPGAYEGRGIALKLVEAAIADARAEGYTIVPLCPYVAVQFRRHPDWAPLLAG